MVLSNATPLNPVSTATAPIALETMSISCGTVLATRLNESSKASNSLPVAPVAVIIFLLATFNSSPIFVRPIAMPAAAMLTPMTAFRIFPNVLLA